MENNHNIESLLSSLDGIQKASPGPYFFTRVQARLQQDQPGTWGSIIRVITRPSIALGTLCLVVVVNAAALFYHREETTAVAQQLEQVSPDEYNTTLASNSYYDENSDIRP